MANNKFKALIIDCDGTLIVSKRDGLPSPKVTSAVNKASQLLHVGLATHRSLFQLDSIFKHLKLTGPSVICGGAQIIDTQTCNVLWEKQIEKKDFFKIMQIIGDLKSQVIIQEGKGEDDKRYSEGYIPEKLVEMGVFRLSESVADELADKLSQISTIAVCKAFSWDYSTSGIVINHAQATKQHGIFEVAKILNVSTHEIIGIGDGYNDFPLLMACGLKVAMGNAVDDLKAIADYVAPSVEDDGVVDVINKFVL